MDETLTAVLKDCFTKWILAKKIKIKTFEDIGPKIQGSKKQGSGKDIFWFPKNIHFNPFVFNAPFLYPLKNLTVFWCFQGERKGALGTNALKFSREESFAAFSFASLPLTVFLGGQVGQWECASALIQKFRSPLICSGGLWDPTSLQGFR